VELGRKDETGVSLERVFSGRIFVRTRKGTHLVPDSKVRVGAHGMG
jgi:hypothetical protein